MPFAARIDPLVFNTIAAHLALLFLTGAAGDMDAAGNAARHTLLAYNPASIEELTLAAEIIGFSMQAVETVGRSANPDLPPNTATRMRSSAASLQRQAHRSRTALDRLRRARKAPPQQEADAPAPAPTEPPNIDKAVAVMEFAQEALKAVNKGQGKAFVQDTRKREMLERMAENARKNRERYAAQQAAAANAATPAATAATA